MDRIEKRFAELKTAGRGALVTFVTAGDPDYAASLDVLKGLPAAGADIIELGMPFSDPMADGPAIQAASVRALQSGMNLKKTLQMAREFRKTDDATPLVLMGYYNPIYSMGVDVFLKEAKESGVDGLIVVDLPPEEDTELCLPAKAVGLHFIRLITPTTDEVRLPAVLKNSSGFVYYVSVAGITGTKSAAGADIASAVMRIKKQTSLPIAVGFGIRTAQQVAEIAAVADAAVVGSAIVQKIAEGQDSAGILRFVSELASGLGNAGTCAKAS